MKYRAWFVIDDEGVIQEENLHCSRYEEKTWQAWLKREGDVVDDWGSDCKYYFIEYEEGD